jgi:diguanylate cyclase (GGDEF)-like protein
MLHLSEPPARTHSTAETPDSKLAEMPPAHPRVYSLDGSAAVQLPEGAWQMSALLQTSLDVEKVVALFAREMAKRVPFDSFVYQHAEKGIELRQGEPTRHRASYRLLLEDRTLGEIALTRARRFSDTEIGTIEALIGGLVYALRNALLYREALESALHDPLTGVANRSALDTTLRREIGLAQRHRLPLSVLVLDIDKFKRINDNHGHAAGDAVLKTLARGVEACIRTTDVLARFGGEEFVVILPGTDSAGAQLLASRIRHAVEALRCDVDGIRGPVALHITVSIGVASLDNAENAEQLLQRADHAMYAAKHLGGNRVDSA